MMIIDMANLYYATGKFVIIGNLLTGSIPSEMGRLNHMGKYHFIEYHGQLQCYF